VASSHRVPETVDEAAGAPSRGAPYAFEVGGRPAITAELAVVEAIKGRWSVGAITDPLTAGGAGGTSFLMIQAAMLLLTAATPASLGDGERARAAEILRAACGEGGQPE
jgi:hypothetical protein